MTPSEQIALLTLELNEAEARLKSAWDEGYNCAFGQDYHTTCDTKEQSWLKSDTYAYLKEQSL